jgi:fructokinase
LQPDPFHPTGTVEVTVDAEGTATYDIAGDVAWDFIGPDARIDGAVRSAACLVYGSLAGRSAVSRTTLFGLLDTAATKVLDINLRHPFFDKDLLERLLMKADILKMNEQECRLVGGMFGLDGAEDERMHRLREMFGLRMILVTAGAAGATLWAPGGPYHDAGRAVEVVDTVGSGDAFLAGFLHRYLGNASWQEALTAAGTMGAFVAGRAGGCPVYDAAETGLF